MSATAAADPVERTLERLRSDTAYYARNFLKIVPKVRSRGLVPFEPNAAQLALHAKLEEQRLAGKPRQAIVLKARQVGISTWVQGELIKGATLNNHLNALVVAHDQKTAAKLYAIGRRMYSNLPNDGRVKPPVDSYRRERFMHYAESGDAWMQGESLPDSSYWVDTAGEFESGRGGTYHYVHFSEYAFYPQPAQKLTAIADAIPDVGDTLWVIESTANGNNEYKDLWDDASEGRSEFIPFFWPWWKQPEYRIELSPADEEEFQIGDADQSPYAEEEPQLVNPGPVDVMTGEHVPLTKGQLAWRRWRIANKSGGSIAKFNQENPTTPEHAFLATGKKVFEPALVSKAMAQASQTDPRYGDGGPISGAISAKERPLRAGQHGRVEVPTQPLFKPARNLLPGETADWRIWLDYTEGKLAIPPDGLYVVGCDVSGGIPESDDENPSAESAYHAIQVIDHKTKAQVAEYRSRCDTDLFAEHAMLTAELFNEAWLAVEVTGGYGGPVVSKVARDWHYRFMYNRRVHDERNEKEKRKVGWDTTRATKPLLLAGGAELLREGTHGIKSRRLVAEMLTYIRNSSGKTMPEKGKFADLLMAWLIAQQVAL